MILISVHAFKKYNELTKCTSLTFNYVSSDIKQGTKIIEISGDFYIDIDLNVYKVYDKSNKGSHFAIKVLDFATHKSRRSNHKLKYADGVIYCEKCEQVITYE